MRTPPRSATGFSLLELLMAMSIAAILASLAWPSFGQALRKARRLDARVALLRVQHAQEQHYTQHLRYADALQGDTGLGLSAHSDSGDYRLALRTSDDGQQYLATAVAEPLGRQGGDATCQAFAVDALGQRSARDAAGRGTVDRCW